MRNNIDSRGAEETIFTAEAQREAVQEAINRNNTIYTINRNNSRVDSRSTNHDLRRVIG
jgi:hypothetical protein